MRRKTRLENAPDWVTAEGEIDEARERVRSAIRFLQVTRRRSVLLRRRKQREGENRPPTQARLRGRQRLRDPRRLHEQGIEATMQRYRQRVYFGIFY
jgi:hypothetical protein